MTDYLTYWAVKRLQSQLKKDRGFYVSWQANIAMSFSDNFNWYYGKKKRPISNKVLYEISNKAADYFLWLLTK